MSLEQQMADAQFRIDLGECVAKLETNRQFNRLIHRHLFVDYAAQQVSALADDATTPEMKQHIMNNLEMVSRFKNWLISVAAAGVQGKKELAALLEHKAAVESGELDSDEEDDSEEI